MRQISCGKLCCSALLSALLYLAAPMEQVQARQPETSKPIKQVEKQQLTAAQAASRARAKHGGKVLKVSPQGKAYRVKLLTDSGRVMSVLVKD